MITQRNLLLALGLVLSGATAAQQQYFLNISGHHTPCDAAVQSSFVHLVSLPGTMPDYDIEVPINTNCYYTVTLELNSLQYGFVITSGCASIITTAITDSLITPPPMGTVLPVVVDFNCSGGDPDCLGVPGGAAVAGSACDDGNPLTFYDMYMPNCVCAGVPEDECLTLVDWYQAQDAGALVPFEVEYSAFTAGAQPITYSWYFGDVTIGLPFVLEGTTTVPSWSRAFSGGESLAFMVVAVDANGCESSYTNVEAIMPCDGMLGSFALPGFPCTTFLGLPGTWTANCECVASSGNCQACFNVIPGGPWAAAFNGNCTTGAAPFTYQWLLPDGSTASSAFATSQFAAPGIYSTCLTTTDGNGCMSTVCDSVSVAASGAVNLYPPGDCNACWTATQATDGLGLPIPFTVTFANCSSGGVPPYSYQYTSNGNWEGSLPPTMTATFSNGYTYCMRLTDSNGCWSVTCMTFNFDADGVLITDPVMYDCLQIPNGPNMPGTACTTPSGAAGTWSPDCDCIANSNLDCEGVAGGSALPGTPCQVPGTMLLGLWSADCICVPDTNTTGCQAGFWVIQAYEPDSLNPGSATPIPYELWVWNLSTGTSPFQFEWDFGDGTSSFDPYPTHVYGASGPYNLCLTLSDAASCTSVYCDEVSIDGDGFYEGMAPENEVRNGFTIHVINQLPAAVPEQRFDDSRVWPNPVTDALNLSFRSTVSGNVPVSIIDLNGRMIRQESLAFVRGGNSISLNAADLPAGLYLLRVGNDTNTMNIRFVKQ